jgi:hypothetical protein
MLPANILKAVSATEHKRFVVNESVGMGNGILTLDTHLIESSLVGTVWS